MTRKSRPNSDRAPNFRYGSETVPKINIRTPGDLHERLLTAAAAAQRSLNSETILRLQESFERDVSWIPQVGMLVKYLDDAGEHTVGTIDSFSMLSDVVYATCKAIVGRGALYTAPLDELEPYRT